VPKNWAWVQLGDIVLKLTDGTHHSPTSFQSGDYLYISAKNIKDDGVSLDEVSYVSTAVHNEIYARCNPEKGDVLYIKDGATTGVVTVNDLDEPFSMLSSVALLKLPTGVYNRLLVAFLRSPFFYGQMRGFMKGAALPRVTLKRMAPALLPLPPRAEQERIVAKVDELMTLLNQLEATQRERESRRSALRTALLQRLTVSDRDEVSTREDVRFFLDRSPRLVTKPEHVTEIRRSILDLAVQGRLVQQEVTDSPAAESLAACDTVRAKIASKDRRATSDAQELLSSEHRWKVPRTWEWRGLADLVLFIDYRGRTPTKIARGVRLITAKNVRRGYLSLHPEEFISESEYDSWMTRGLPAIGDILFTTEAPMGNAAVVRLTEKFGLAQRVINFRPYSSIDPDFLVLQLTSDPFQRILDLTATGLTAKGIKAAKLKRLPTAVPPLAEQQRIVAKVDELMTVCDKLEAALASAQTGRERLLEVLLHEALAGAG
jgi:type I restriction enzyme, S subunit